MSINPINIVVRLLKKLNFLPKITIEGSKNVFTGTIEGDNTHLGDNIIYNYYQDKAFAKSILKKIQKLEDELAKIEDTPENESLRHYLQIQREEAYTELKDCRKRMMLSLTELEKFSSIHNSDRLRKAIQHIEEGNFEAADELLNLDDLKKEQKEVLETKELKQEMDQKAKDNALQFLLKARLETINFSDPDWIDKAIQIFQDSIKSFSYFQNNFDLATFLFDHNKEPELSEKHYKAALKDQSISEEQEAEVYLKLAELHQSRNESQWAEINFQKAILLRQDLLNKKNAGTYLNLAKALNAKGRFYQQEETFEEAEVLFRKADDLLTTKSLKQTNEILELRSSIINNLGIVLWHKLGGNVKSVHQLEEALSLFEKVKIPEQQKREATFKKASILSNIASCYNVLGQFDAAKNNYNLALNKFEELAGENPYRYEKDLGKEHINLGILYLNQNNKAPSRKHTQKGMQLIEKYMAAVPELETYFERGKQVLSKIDTP